MPPALDAARTALPFRGGRHGAIARALEGRVPCDRLLTSDDVPR